MKDTLKENSTLCSKQPPRENNLSTEEKMAGPKMRSLFEGSLYIPTHFLYTSEALNR